MAAGRGGAMRTLPSGPVGSFWSVGIGGAAMNDTAVLKALERATPAQDNRPLRILHVLDQSIPVHSGYTFRTLAILSQQRAQGWETYQLTSPKQGGGSELEEQIDDWLFYRTPGATGFAARLPLLEYRYL